MSKIQLFQGNCLDILKNIPDKSIDMILSDLPYGKTQCKWDIMLPVDEIWELYNRIIKDNGAVCLFGIEPFSSMIRMANIKYYKYDWIWKKPRGTGHLNARKQPLRDVEMISVFYKKQCIYNPQFSVGEPYSKLKGGKNSYVSECGETTYGKFMNGQAYRNDNSGFRYPKQILEFCGVERNTLHPTQKPVALCEYLIKTYTNEGMTVLDSCMGSGTTGVACSNLNRNFIGIELDDKYFKIAKARIENT